MADVRAVKNGNWSDTTVWNTGALPTTADDVYSNTFTVNVDTSFEVLSLRNTSGTGITAGGTFNFNSGSISGSTTGVISNAVGAANLITVTATTGTVSLSLASAILGNAAATSYPIISYTGACNFNLTTPTVNGSQTQVTSVSDIYTINKSSIGTITINGDVIGGNAANNRGNMHALFATAGSTIINGNVSGFSNSNTGTNNGINQSAGSLTVNGNVTGGAAGTTSGLLQAINFSGTTLTISGSVTGGSGANGVVCSSAATINIIGPITPSSAASAISLSGASTLTYSGSLASSANQPAIISSNASATNIFTGPFTNTNNTMAVQCVDMVLTADASTFWNFGDITLYSPEQLAYYPSASDIRQGTTYADGTVSGSLAMPPPTAVIAGTPTDNTTGSAVLTPTQLQDAVWGRDLAQMTETGSIGYRLAKSATTDSTGKQIASYLI